MSENGPIPIRLISWLLGGGLAIAVIVGVVGLTVKNPSSVSTLAGSANSPMTLVAQCGGTDDMDLLIWKNVSNPVVNEYVMFEASGRLASPEYSFLWTFGDNDPQNASPTQVNGAGAKLVNVQYLRTGAQRVAVSTYPTGTSPSLDLVCSGMVNVVSPNPPPIQTDPAKKYIKSQQAI